MQALAHELAGPVDVGAVFEDNHDLRKAVAGEGPHVGDARKARELGFDIIGDGLLHLLGLEGPGLGVYDHLYAGDVGYGVYRQRRGRV